MHDQVLLGCALLFIALSGLLPQLPQGISVSYCLIKKINKYNILMKSKMTATEIISKRDDCLKSIKSNWEIIRQNIHHDTRQTPKYDLMSVYKLIQKTEKDVVKYKLYSQCLNIGFTTIDQLSANTSYRMIYELSQLKERRERLASISATKAPKGKHIEALLKPKFFEKEVSSLDKQISTIEIELKRFNEEKTFIVDECV